MAYLTLPVRSDLPAYRFEIELELVVYKFEFTFNAREGRWFMDILKADGTHVLCGVKLLTSWPLVSRFQSPDLPPGELFLLDTANENKDPGRDDLGERVLLIYRESDTA